MPAAAVALVQVLDGVDCLLLGAETLRGSNPPNAVRTVVSCCHAAEAEFQHSSHFDYLMREAMKAEAGGIAIPGGPEADGMSPESSAHGSGAALAAMGASRNDSRQDLSGSQSHGSLRRALNAMTANAPTSGPNSSLSALLRFVLHIEQPRVIMSGAGGAWAALACFGRGMQLAAPGHPSMH